MIKKKGDMQHTALLLLIVAAFGLIIYIVFFAELKDIIGTTSEDETCRISAAIKAKTKGPLGTESPVGLSCKINDFNSDAHSKEEVKLEIAKEMYRCWYKYGEGKIDFYGSWDPGASETHCLICSRIHFEEDAENITFEEFGSYLNSPLPGREETFAEYFTQTPQAKIQIGAKPGEGTTPNSLMDLEKGLYVVFRVNKHNEDNQAIASLFTGGEEDLSYTTTGALAAEGVAYQGVRSVVLGGGEVISGWVGESRRGKPIIINLIEDSKGKLSVSAGSNGVGNTVKKMNDIFKNGGTLNSASKIATKKGYKKVSKTGLKTVVKKVALAGEKAAIGVASKVVGKKVAGKFIPVAGWGLAIYDGVRAFAWADELHPAVVIYGVSDISEACDTLA
jgi:hypothetical protein